MGQRAKAQRAKERAERLARKQLIDALRQPPLAGNAAHAPAASSTSTTNPVGQVNAAAPKRLWRCVKFSWAFGGWLCSVVLGIVGFYTSCAPRINVSALSLSVPSNP